MPDLTADLTGLDADAWFDRIDALGEELLALFPRNCDRMAIQPDLQFKPGGIIPLGNINVR